LPNARQADKRAAIRDDDLLGWHVVQLGFPRRLNSRPALSSARARPQIEVGSSQRVRQLCLAIADPLRRDERPVEISTLARLRFAAYRWRRGGHQDTRI